MLWPAKTGNRPRRQASPKSLHGSYVAAARGRPCGTTSRDDASGALNAVRSQVGAPLAGRTLLRMGYTAMSGAAHRGRREWRGARSCGWVTRRCRGLTTVVIVRRVRPLVRMGREVATVADAGAVRGSPP